MNDDFYSSFPSLNPLSKENQRYKRISQDFLFYLSSGKQQQRDRQESLEETVNIRNEQHPFSSEARNKFESKLAEERQVSYQIALERQIEEQRYKKQEEIQRLKKEEELMEKRFQKQLEEMKLQKDLSQEKVVVERICRRNENECYNNDTKISSSSKNNVYRYFSQSARRDSDLFNYKKLFGDIDQSAYCKRENDLVLARKRHEQLAIELIDASNTNNETQTAPKKPEINSCPSCFRCHKKLKIYCSECSSEKIVIVPPEATNQLQIEYGKPYDMNNQQVVINMQSEQTKPFSFNADENSMFYKDALKDLRNYSEIKLTNYLKNYGDLKKTKLNKKNEVGNTQILTKLNPKVNELSGKPQKLHTLELDDILSKYTVITQVGYAKKHLQLEIP